MTPIYGSGSKNWISNLISNFNRWWIYINFDLMRVCYLRHKESYLHWLGFSLLLLKAVLMFIAFPRDWTVKKGHQRIQGYIYYVLGWSLYLNACGIHNQIIENYKGENATLRHISMYFKRLSEFCLHAYLRI